MVRVSGGMEEECERERELEREREEELQKETTEMQPRSEVDWYVRASLFTLPSQLPDDTGVIHLADFIKYHLQPTTINQINWSSCIFGTRNFFSAVLSPSGASVLTLTDYLRVADTCVCYQNGQVLLVSEREADILIDFCSRPKGIIRAEGSAKPFSQVLHLSLATLSIDRELNGSAIKGINGPLMVLKGSGGRLDQSDSILLKPAVLTELQLFAGETMYSNRSTDLKLLLSQIPGQPSASGQPEHIVDLREKHRDFPFSDLEKICKEVAVMDVVVKNVGV